ncbi:MAG: hypothetical protein IPL61_17975 [Myxococcales bacterium]|nr:hypothetical protein [Myxococcales bacterium]
MPHPPRRHRRRIALAPLLVVAAVTTACGSKAPSAANQQICEQAAARYVRCVGEELGPEAQRMAASPDKDGVAACARSQRTVDWYRDKCLPTTTCKAFMDCTLDLAMQEP